MAAQLGKRMVLYIESDTPGTYVIVGGQRMTRATINNTNVDITDKQSDSWTELLANAGGRNVAVAVEGIYKGTAGETKLNAQAMVGGISNFRVVFVDDNQMFSGAWQITSLEHNGQHDSARMFTLALASSGEIAYGPVS